MVMKKREWYQIAGGALKFWKYILLPWLNYNPRQKKKKSSMAMRWLDVILKFYYMKHTILYAIVRRKKEISKMISNQFPQVQECLFIFVFLGLHPWYMEVPRLGQNRSCSCWPAPQPQQCGIQAASATYTTAHSNTGSLTHWARPGIEPATSWFLVRFVNHCATKGTHQRVLKWKLPERRVC